jgi:hypothetical protein
MKEIINGGTAHSFCCYKFYLNTDLRILVHLMWETKPKTEEIILFYCNSIGS